MVTIRTGEAVRETARQLWVAKECHERLGVEITPWSSEVRFKVADGNTESGRQVIVTQYTREEP
jgi:hypothetical protein